MNYAQNKVVRALGLCSGGLDSILAALVLKNQGIDVEWISFETPFFSSDKAIAAASKTNIPLTVKNITIPYLGMLKNPPCGFGRNMNPCMDCHALMFRIAGDFMRERKIDFLFSGEVLGQRPMSQTRSSLRYVEKHSGLEGYIVRPLSARHLEETIPEKNGKIDRKLLLGFSGRSRKNQIQLARQWNVVDYPAPAGGCLLTDKTYSRRLKDLFLHCPDFNENDIHLLKFGRHIRLNDKVKIIIGRTSDDNNSICCHHDPDRALIMKSVGVPGPVSLVPIHAGEEDVLLAASISAGYIKSGHGINKTFALTSSLGTRDIEVSALSPDFARSMMI